MKRASGPRPSAPNGVVEVAEVESPLGTLSVAVTGGTLRALVFGGVGMFLQHRLGARLPVTALREGDDPGGVAARLRAYFDGRLEALDEIAVAPAGTPFQQRVWTALRRVPAGRTCSYAGLAEAIGAPAAVRAVGAANGANPIPLVIPCHRVIGADGRLVGYGGGIERKRWLLRHEGAGVREDARSALPLFTAGGAVS